MRAMTVRERQNQAREEAILDAAQELMARRGYLAMTMDDLAAALAVSKATLYLHFRSKEDLAVSVLTRIIQGGLAYLRSLDPSLPAVRRIEMIVGYILQRRYGGGPVDLSNQLPALLPTLATRPVYQATIREVASRMSDLVEAAKADGDVDPGLSTPVVVRAMLGILRDADYQPLLDEGLCTLDDLKHTVMGLFLRGLRPGGSHGQP